MHVGQYGQQKRHSPDSESEQLTLKTGDIRVRTNGGLTALDWKDRQKFIC